MKLLAQLFEPLRESERDTFEEGAVDYHLTAAFVEAVGMSHGDISKLLRDALRAAHPGENTYPWQRDVFDDAVVYELSTPDHQTNLYQRTYTIANGAVTLGDPLKVIAVTNYLPADQGNVTVPATPITQVSAPAEESATELTGDLVPLVERSVKEDGTASIRIIAPGQGSSGYYPADVLKRDGPKVFTAGTHIYLDHPSKSEAADRPERSVKDLAGSLTGPAEWREDGLYAPVKFIDTVAPHVNAIAPFSGMSIHAGGKYGTRKIDGKNVQTVESIDRVHSVDVVTIPGAGGKVIDLLESARAGRLHTPTEDDDVSKEELEAAQKRIQELESREADRDRELARLREADLFREARGIVVTELAKIALPQVTRDRLTESLAANPPTKDGTLDREALVAKVTEAATAEMTYLASVNGGNPVRSMGGDLPALGSTPTLEESGKRIETALASL